ncbi:MAG: hypothetical protein ACLUTK_15385, partial [[Clostridium] leptum]
YTTNIKTRQINLPGRKRRVWTKAPYLKPNLMQKIKEPAFSIGRNKSFHFILRPLNFNKYGDNIPLK